MKVIVIGLGSMGKRRVRLLRQLCPDVVIGGVDFSAQRREEAASLGVAAYGSVDEAVAALEPEAAFVCSPPASHCPIIRDLLLRDIDVFTELNLVNKGYEELERLAAERGRTVFMSSTPLYRREVQRIRQLTSEQGRPLSYHLHIGQYLPDWHPWENIQDFFVSHPETNGCREIFAIQLPWLLKTFGPLKEGSLMVCKASVTDLPLGFPDCCNVLLAHENGSCGVVQVDVAARKPLSGLEVVGEQLQIHWDGTPNGLYVLDLGTKQMEHVSLYDSFEQNSSYAANIIEDAYAEEIDTFLKVRRGEAEPLWSLAEDAEVLALIDRIEA